MPDAWEWLWLLGDDLPTADPDGDGLSNVQEYTGDPGATPARAPSHPLEFDTDSDGKSDGVDGFRSTRISSLPRPDQGAKPNSASKLSSSWAVTASAGSPHSSMANSAVTATFAGSLSAPRSGPR